MIRDAIANALQERWPKAKITDTVDFVYGDCEVTSNPATRINIEMPIAACPEVGLRIASIDINGKDIEASFYGGGKYSQDLHHPQSLTELEKLLEEHVKQMAVKLDYIVAVDA